MSKQQFKPLHELVANKLAAELKDGTSFIQKPVKDNGQPAFITPVNPNSGKGYSALNALNLSMRGYDDPRWMSAKDAGYAGFLVKEGSKGTLINFPKNNDIQAIRDVNGEKILDEEGKTQTKTVEFEKPQNGKAFLFNGSQINDIPPLADFLKAQQEAQSLSPLERAEKLVAESKAVIVHGGQEAYYDKAKDQIHLPEKDQFENETAYYQAAVHQLAHWSGHESRLNRPMDGRLGSQEYGKEELRAAVAAALIGGELKIGHKFGQHAAYSNNWAKLLRDDPFEINRAARDAQKIVNLFPEVSQKREQKQSTDVKPVSEVKKEPERKPGFEKGEEIPYLDNTYKVLETYKTSKNIKVEDAFGDRKTLKPTDGIYNSLLEAKKNTREPEMVIDQEQEQSHQIGR